MTDLEKYRSEIDKIDEKIVELLAQRTEVVYKVSRYKARNNIMVVDKNREAEVYKQVKNIAVKNDLDENFVKKIFEIIIEECRKIQRIKR